MKSRIIAIFISTTLLLTLLITACDTSKETAVSTTQKENREPVSKTIDQVAEVVLAAYPDLSLNEIYSKDYSTEPNLSLGVKALRLLDWGSHVPDDDMRKYSHISVYIFEMDTESEAYKSLVSGKKIEYFFTDDLPSDQMVLAINGQYVFAAEEVYLASEDDAFQTTNWEPPFHFEGIDKALQAFKDFK